MSEMFILMKRTYAHGTSEDTVVVASTSLNTLKGIRAIVYAYRDTKAPSSSMLYARLIKRWNIEDINVRDILDKTMGVDFTLSIDTVTVT